MNNEGWGLRIMLLFVAILCVALMISIYLIQRNFSFMLAEDPYKFKEKDNINENVTVKKTYSGIEKEMISSAKKYVKKIYNDNPEEADFLKIKVSSMQKEGLLGTINDIKDKAIVCSGYVSCRMEEDNSLSYEPYLKCGKKYTTKGYIDRFDDEK